MGSMISNARHHLRNLVIRAVVRALRLVSPSLDALVRRLRQSPGIPVADPTQSYWTTPPSEISRHNSESTKLPEYADIVIIGSGISGASFARTILDWESEHAGKVEPLQVVMLEARDTCSGATGRNGGHITPILYADYTQLKEQYGSETAKQIIRFRLSHFPQLLEVAREEGLLEESQCREVEAFDVFHDISLYQTAKSKLNTYMEDLPAESVHYKVHEGADNIKDLQLSNHTVGCFSTRAGVIHPYRFVTGILSRLLQSYPSSFRLFTQTPCTAIYSPDTRASTQLYNVATPKGIIQTPHIIHATNGWISHLLPGMRGKILPARGVMTAQRPWKGLAENPIASTPSLIPNLAKATSWTSTRSFVFFPNALAHCYDYLTQQCVTSDATGSGELYPQPEGELMLGGGFARDNAFLTELGNANDREWDAKTGEYLAHALDRYFDAGNNVAQKAKAERVKATWSGILGISVDEKPWVGKIPEKVSGRCAPRAEEGPGGSPADEEVPSKPSDRLAAPGEWMTAGYSGEGMVHAWMSGKALAYMVLGRDKAVDHSEKGDAIKGDIEEWFPPVFRISEARWQNTGIEDLFAAFVSG